MCQNPYYIKNNISVFIDLYFPSVLLILSKFNITFRSLLAYSSTIDLTDKMMFLIYFQSMKVALSSNLH